MNCKPNQQAVITRTLGVPEMRPFIGMVFTVREVSRVNPRYGPVWRVDLDNRVPAHAPTAVTSNVNIYPGETITEISDAVLTPLDGGEFSDAALDKIIKEIEHV